MLVLGQEERVLGLFIGGKMGEGLDSDSPVAFRSGTRLLVHCSICFVPVQYQGKVKVLAAALTSCQDVSDKQSYLFIAQP